MTPIESSKLQADALLAAYREKKAEISRRSTLAWTATAGYLVLAFSAASAIAHNEHLFAWPLSVWVVSATAYLFVYSQYGTIMALSGFIQNHIEPTLTMIARSRVSLLGERGEVHGGVIRFLDKWHVLLLVTFLGVPSALTGFAIHQGGPCEQLAVLWGIGGVAATAIVFGLRMSPP